MSPVSTWRESAVCVAYPMSKQRPTLERYPSFHQRT